MNRSNVGRLAAVAVLAASTSVSGTVSEAPARPDGLIRVPTPTPAADMRSDHTGEHEFDFLIGEWRVRHRRLRKILRHSTDWYEFDGALVARKIWNGRGHVDEFVGTSPFGTVDGMSIRIYEPASRQWRDYYTGASSRILNPPLVGRFQAGRAEFYGHELFEGQGIFVRQIWTPVTSNTCRWEQAFSADGGKSWETNWVMDLTR